MQSSESRDSQPPRPLPEMGWGLEGEVPGGLMGWVAAERAREMDWRDMV